MFLRYFVRTPLLKAGLQRTRRTRTTPNNQCYYPVKRAPPRQYAFCGKAEPKLTFPITFRRYTRTPQKTANWLSPSLPPFPSIFLYDYLSLPPSFSLLRCLSVIWLVADGTFWESSAYFRRLRKIERHGGSTNNIRGRAEHFWFSESTSNRNSAIIKKSQPSL